MSVPFEKIAKALEKSDAGKSLKRTERWSVFRADESSKLWREIVGEAANVYEHSLAFFRLGEDFIKLEEKILPKDREIFLYSLICHDFGEAIIDGKGVGDVASFKKDKKTEGLEREIAKKVIKSLKLNEQVKKRLNCAYDLVITGRNKKLNFAFKALERVDYAFTAIYVFEKCREREKKNLAVIKHESDLVGRVFARDLAYVLNECVNHFVNSIGHMLKKKSGVIESIYDHIYPYAKSDGYLEKFEKSYKSWKKFVSK